MSLNLFLLTRFGDRVRSSTGRLQIGQATFPPSRRPAEGDRLFVFALRASAASAPSQVRQPLRSEGPSSRFSVSLTVTPDTAPGEKVERVDTRVGRVGSLDDLLGRHHRNGDGEDLSVAFNDTLEILTISTT